MTGVRCKTQESDARKRTEDRGQRTEDREQRTEDREQRTEDSRKTENRNKKPETRNCSLQCHGEQSAAIQGNALDSMDFVMKFHYSLFIFNC